MGGFLSSCRKDFTSPPDFESVFVTAGDNETKERLRVEEAIG